MQRTSLYVLALVAFLSSCDKKRTRYTESGMKYILYTEHNGAKPVLGDYVTFEMVYKTEQDSVLFDSRKNNSPFRIQLVTIPFQGSLEEGLTCLSEGDSATFFVSADSLRENMLKKHLEAGKQSMLRPGSLARFDVRLIRVQRKADAEKEIADRLMRRKQDEARLISEYLERKKSSAVPDSNGIYVLGGQYSTSGIKDGDTVSLWYAAKYLNEITYETNREKQNPFEFVMGAGQVLPAWETGLQDMATGSKVTLVVPSAMAYGEEGLFSAARGNYLVAPYTPLVYELEVVQVKAGGRKSAAK